MFYLILVLVWITQYADKLIAFINIYQIKPSNDNAIYQNTQS